MRRILVTGASGQLGSYLLRHLAQEPEFAVAGWSSAPVGSRFGTTLRPVDLRHRDQVAAAFHEDSPDLIIHAAAVCRVDVCYADPQLAHDVNVEGTRRLTELARQRRARLVYVSTDMVFDGQTGNYGEEDPAVPLSRYGQSKLAGERVVLDAPRTLVARISLLFGPSLNGRPSFFDQQVAAITQSRPITLFTDEWRTPLSLAIAASALVALARSELTGVLHLGGPERMSRWEMGVRLAEALGRDATLLKAGRQADGKFPEPRPRDISLDSTRWRMNFPDHPWPQWDEAIRELRWEHGARSREHEAGSGEQAGREGDG